MTVKELASIYYIYAELYLANRYGIMELDKRFDNCKFEYHKKNDHIGNGMNYMRLFNNTHIDRLNDDELSQLSEIGKGNVEVSEIAEFIKKTYGRVLSGVNKENADYMFYNSISGEGVLPDNTIIFQMDDEILENETIDVIEAKRNMFENVKFQYEDLIKKKGQGEVRIVRFN